MKPPRLPRLSHSSGLLRAPLKVPRTDASALVNGRRGPRPLARSLSGFATTAAICAALFAGVGYGNAATLYWDTDGSTTGNSSSTGIGLGGTGTWDTTISNWWSGSALGAWNNNDTAFFWGTAGTVTLGSGITVGGLQFNTSGYTVTGNGTNTLTLAGATPGVTLGSGVSLAAVNALLAGSAGMAFNGGSSAGTLFLNGANANTYTGSATIDSGTLRMGSLTALGASGAGNTTTVNSGGALRVSVGGTVALEQLSLAGTGVSGGGALVVDAASTATTWSGAVTIAASGATINIGRNASFVQSTTPMVVTGNLIKDGLGVFVLGNTASTGTGTLTVNGGTFSANGTKWNSGAITVSSGGTLQVSGTGTDNIGGQNVTISSGGVLDWQNTSTTADGIGALNLNGAGNNNTGAWVANASGGQPLTPTSITLAGATTVGGAGNLKTTTTITGGGNAFTKVGLGTFTSTNSTTGSTPFGNGSIVLQEGTLSLVPATAGSYADTGANAAAGSTFTYSGGGSFVLTRTTTTGNVLTYTIGNASAAANSVLVRSGKGTLVITSTAIANLGLTANGENFIITNQTLASNKNGAASSAGIYDASVVGLASNVGTFLSYGTGTNGLGAGFATGSYTAAVAASVIAANTISDVTSSIAVSDLSNPYALRVGAGLTLTNSGTTTVNGGAASATNSGIGGVILNTATASTITGGTLAFGSSEGAVFVSSATANGTIASAITGSGGLTKFGPGTLVLSSSNAFTGGVNINQGALSVSADAHLGDATNGITFNGGASLFLNAAGTYARSVTLNNTAPVTIQGGNYSAILSGAVTGSGALTIASTAATFALTLSNTANSFTGPIRVGGNLIAATLTVSSLADSSNPISLGGTSTGAGSLIWGTGATGPLTLNNRQIDLAGTTAAGTIDNSNATAANTVTINTDLLVSGVGAKTLTLQGANTGANTFAGKISDGAGSLIALTKAGSGNWILSGTNTYTGVTTVNGNGGTLQVGAANGLPNASGVLTTALTVTAGTLDLNGYGFTTGATATTLGGGAAGTVSSILTGASTLTLGGDVTYSATNNPSGATISGNLSLNNATRTFTVGDSSATASDLVISAAIVGGGSSGALTKAGTGTLVLSGANTYTGGTTLSAGTLSVAADSVLGAASGALTFSGGSLQVTGTALTSWSGSRTLNFTGGATLDIADPSNTFTLGVPAITAGGAFTKAGQGALVLTNSLAMGGNAFNVSGGLMTLSNGITNSTGGTFSVGGTASANAAFVQTSGTSLLSQADADTLSIGNNGNAFGSFTIAGGTFQATRIQPAGTTGTNNSGLITVLAGGTLKLTTYFIGGRSAASNTGVATIAGGTLDIASISGGTGFGTYGGGRFEMNFGPNLGGANTGGIFDAGTRTFTVVANGTTSQGILNLLGGTMTAGSISSASSVTGLAQLNFNGGTLKAGVANATFLNSNLTSAVVYSGGGTIDNNGFAITIAEPLLAPSGNGVASVSVSGGSGYFTAPLVKLTGGGGNGDATAVAVLNGDGSMSVVITNPGTGYTSAPAVTLVGGTNGTTASGTATLNTGNVSGGMTFTGSATTTLSGANTYTGPTVISSGPLALALASGSQTLAGNISGAGSLVHSAAGTTVLSGTNSYAGTTTISAGTLQFANPASLYNNTPSSWTSGNISVASGSTLALSVGGTGEFTGANVDTFFASINGASGGFQSGSTLALDPSNAAGGITVSTNFANTNSGANILNIAKIGTGALTLSGASTHTGNTTVSGGTLNITGSLTGDGTASSLNFGPSAASSVVNLSGTVFNYYTFQGASVANSVAVYNQTGGTVSFTNTLVTDNTNLLSNNATGYGFMNITGGTTNTLGRVNFAKSGTGVVYVGGSGTLNLTGEWAMLMFSGSGQSGAMTIGPGGVVNRVGASSLFGIFMNQANQYGVLNLAGGSLLTSTKSLSLGNSSGGTNNIGLINLAGGTFEEGVNMTQSVGTSTGQQAFFNFAGGTLKAVGALTAAFPVTVTGQTVTATLFGPIDNAGTSQDFIGGFTVDTNGNAVTIGTPLGAATGYGVTQSSLTIPSTGNAGYVGAPFVKFSAPAGGGAPASGYALISGGQVTGLVITAPGTYALNETPTVTLTGGGGSIAAFNTAALTTANISGGLTKNGTGTLTLTGINTFTGALTINAGSVVIGTGGALTTSALAGNSGRIVVANSGGGVLLDSATFQDGLRRSVHGTSSGAVLVTSTTASSDVNLGTGAAGAVLPSMFLGASGAVTYTGAYTPGTAGVYRLGGGGGTLTYATSITDASTTNRSSVTIGGAAGSGTVILSGTNTFTGGLSLSNGYTLQIPSGTVAANFGTNPAGLSTSGTAVTIQWGSSSTVDISSGLGAISGGLSLGATTTNLDTNGNNISLAGSLGNGGSGGVAKLGSGILTLSAANTFTGGTSVSAGSLVLANSDALSKSTLTAITNTGAAPNIAFDSSVSSRVFTLGGLTGSVSMTLQDNAGTPNAITLRVGNNNTSQTYSGVLSGSGGLTKTGYNTLTLTGQSTYTGTTSIINGLNIGSTTASILKLDFATATPATNLISSSSALSFGGTAPPNTSPSASQIAAAAVASGQLTLTGKASTTNSQTFNGTSIGLGGATIVLTANATANPLALTLGSITRSAGGTLDITQPTGTLGTTNGVQTTSGTAGTILKDSTGTAFATIGNTDWAFKDATNAWLVAGTYTAASAAASFTGDADITASFTATSGSTVNSIRLNSGTARTLTLAGINTINTGGILFGSTAATATTITGGTIKPTGTELVVINNSTTGVLGSVLADGSAATSVTFRSNPSLGSAKGDLKINPANTYTGNTYLTGGRIQLNATTSSTPFGTGSVYVFGNTNAQYLNTTITVANRFYIVGNGWSESNGPYGALRVDSGTLSGGITLMGDASIGAVGTGTGTISGAIDGNYNLEKRGNYQLTLSGNNSGFAGTYSVSAGALLFSSANAFGAPTGISLSSGGSAVAGFTGVQTALVNKVLSGSAGTIALTSTSAGENIDFSAVNNAGVFLGAGPGSTITYGGTFTPNTSNGLATYRLGGGGGTLTYGSNITGASAVVIGGGYGNNSGSTVVLSGTNTFTGGITIGSSIGSSTSYVTLQTPNSTTPFASMGNGPLVFNSTYGGVQLNGSVAAANADLSSAPNLTSITLSAGTAAFDTGTVGSLASPVIFAKGIGNYGGGVFQKVGTGVLRLDGTNTYTGNTTVNGGTLLLNSANPFNYGFSNTGAASAAVLTLTSTSTFVIKLLADATIGTVASTNTTTTSVSTSTLSLNGRTLTLAGTASSSYSAKFWGGDGVSGTGALTKTGSGTHTFQSTTAYTGATSVLGGTLKLDWSILTTTPASNIINSSSPLVFGGGTLNVKNATTGSISQSFASTTILPGASAFTASLNGSTAITLGLGAITRSVAGGTIDFDTGFGTGGITTSTSNSAGTLLGGYATAGLGTSFATSNGTNITALSAFSSAYTAGADVDNGTLNSIGSSALSINSLRFNNASAVTLDATAGLTIASGGLLITSTVGANATAINGGTITSGNGLDLIVHQFNSSGTATIGSKITGAIGLTKSGSGTLIIGNGSNDYTGATTIGGSGYLQVNATGALSNGSVNLQSAGGLSISGGVTLANNINLFNATGTSSQGAIYAVGSGVATVSGTVTVNQSVSAGGVFGASGASLVVAGPVNAGAGQIVGARVGTVTFSGGGTYDYFINNAATVLLGANNGLSTSAVAEIAASGTASLDLSGYSQTLAGLTRVSANSATVTNSSLTASTLTLNVAGASGAYAGDYTYAGALTGNLALVKSGAGRQVLSGTNTFTGGTTLSAGILVLGSSTALGSVSGLDPALTINGGFLDLNGIANVHVSAFSGTGGTVTDNALGAGASVLSVLSNNSATFAGSFADGAMRSVAFKKDGTGTLTLTGASTHTGVTEVFAGVLHIRNSSALGSTTGATTVFSGAALELQGGIAVGAEPLTLRGSGSGLATGALRNISGTNSFGGAITLGSAARINADAGALTLGGTLTGANFPLTLGGAGDITLGGGLSLGTAGIIKEGNGTLSLQGAGTFSGTTTVSVGTLNIRHGSALGTADGTTGTGTTVAVGAVLQIQGGIAVGNESLIAPILQNVSANNSWAGSIRPTTGGDLTLQSDAGTLTLSGSINAQSADAVSRAVTLAGAGNGVIAGAISNPASLTKLGAGTWQFSGAQNYTVDTTLSGGVLQAGAANAFSSGSNVVLANLAGVILDLNGFSQTIKSLSGGGSLGGNVTLGSGTLTTGGSATTTYSGAISGTGSVIKQGAGSMILATGGSISASAGLQVAAGSLFINGSTAAGTAITVASNAILGGTGSVGGAVTVSNGGILEAGQSGSGQLTLGSVTFGATTGDLGTINLANIASGSPSILNTGALSTLGGADTVTINTTMSGSLSNGSYTLINYSGSLTGFSAFRVGTIGGLSGRQIASLQNSGAAIQLLVAGDAPKWTGYDTTAGSNSASWRVSPTPTNWKLVGGGAATDFRANDSALFDDSATGSTTVDIDAGHLSPTSLEFNNSSLTYTVQSSGGYGIAGSTGLLKNGSGQLTLANANSFTGGVVINAGVITLSNAAALGSSNALSFGPAAAAGTKLQLSGNNATFSALTTNATPGAPVIENGAATGNAVLTINLASGTNTFAGVLQDGAAATLGLTKSGAGALVLTGTNTLTGGVTVGAGILQVLGSLTGASAVTGGSLLVGNGGTLGSLSGSVALSSGALLVFNRSNAFTHPADITGAGSLTLQGGGTMTLTGNAAHSGGTTIAAGTTLQIGSGGATGALTGSGAVSNSGALVYNRDGTAASTIVGAIGGTGSLTVSAGTLILTGTNTFNGAQTISAGATLQVGAGGTTGTLGGALTATNNGVLALSRSDAVTVSTNVSGSGALNVQMAGSGSLTLTGTNSYSGGTNVQAGTLVIGAGSAFPTGTAIVIGSVGGAGTLDLAGCSITVSSLAAAGTAVSQTITNSSTTTATLTVSGSGSNVFGGSIADGSPSKKTAVTIVGGGVLTLSKTNSYTGGTTVTNGTAQLGANNGLGTGALSLGGSGTVGILDLNGFSQTVSSFAVGSGGTAASQIIGNSSTTADGVFNYSGSGMTFNSTIQDALGSGTRRTGLTLSGAGTFVLPTNQGFSGTTTIGSSVTLQLGTGSTTGAIGSGAVINSGTLVFNRSNAYALNAGNLVTGSGIVTLATSGTVASAVDAQFNTTGSLTMGGSAGSTAVTNFDLTNGGATFGSLLVQTNSASVNTITLGSGKTLRVNGAVTVGYNSSATSSTKLTLTGASATFTIGAAGAPTNANVQIGNGQTTQISNGATLDLSGLGTFYANLGTGTLRIGDPANSGGTSAAGSTLILAPTSTILATTITQDSPSGFVTQAIKLGSGTNTLWANTITIGGAANRGTGTLDFNAGSGSLTVRNLAGNGRAIMDVQNGNAGTGVDISGAVNLVGHSADLLLSTLSIGGRSAQAAGSGTGLFSFDTGTLDATTVVVASRTGTAATTGNVTGTLNLMQAGGTGSVTIGTLNMAVNSASTATTSGRAIAALNIGGGTVAITTMTMANNSIGGGSTAQTTSPVSSTVTITGGSTTVGTLNMNVNSSANTGTNNASVSVLNISGGSLTVGSGGINMANASTAAATATTSLSITGTGSLTLGGNLTYINGAGTENTSLSLSGGTLDMGGFSIGAAGALVGSGSGALTLASGTLKNVAEINGGAAVTLGSSGNTLTLEGTNTFSGTVTVPTGATLQVGTGSSSGTLGSGAVANNGSLVLNRTGSYSFAGAISGSGSFTHSGTATTTLSGPSSFSGGAALNAGTLRVGVDSVGSAGSITSGALGTGTLTLAGGALSSDSTTARTLYNAVSMTADTTLGDGTNSGTLTLGGAVNLGGAVRILTVASAARIDGAISNGGLTKAGAGTLTLGGTNTFSAGVDVNAGTLSISASNNLGDASNAISLSGGTLQSTGASVDLGVNRALSLGNSGGTLDVSGSNVLTLSGAISGSTSLTKTGTGTLDITSTTGGFTGSVNANGGTLQMTGTLAGATSVTVTSGTLLLADNERINDTASLAMAGGTFNLNGFSETLGTLTLSANSTIDFGTNASASSVLIFSGAGSFTAGQTLSFANFGVGSDRVLFSNSVSGVLGQISLNGSAAGETQVSFGGSNYYELTAVPEPSTWVAGGLLLGMLAYRERRRFKRR